MRIDGHGQPTIPKEKIPPNAPADVREQILRLYSQDVKEGVDVIFALGEMSDPVAVEPLIDVSKDKDIMLRDVAALSLSRLTGKNFGMDEATWKDWWKKNRSGIR